MKESFSFLSKVCVVVPSNPLCEIQVLKANAEREAYPWSTALSGRYEEYESQQCGFLEGQHTLWQHFEVSQSLPSLCQKRPTSSQIHAMHVILLCPIATVVANVLITVWWLLLHAQTMGMFLVCFVTVSSNSHTM